MVWVQLFMALLAYLGAKKKGASSTEAAFIGVGAGLATHYVVNNTQWGQKNLQPINDSIDGFFGIGQGTIDDGVVRDGDGEVVIGPEDAVPVRQPDGSIAWIPKAMLDASGSFTGKLIDGTAGVLKSWGGYGTSAVIGTAKLDTDYLPWIIGGVAAVVLLK